MNKQFKVTSDLHASQGQRVGNYVIDLVAQVIGMVVLEIIIIVIAEQMEIYSIGDFFDNTNRLQDYLIGVVMTLLYYIPMEVFLSRTVGKYVTGTIVVMEDGTKPDALTIVKRTFCRAIPFDVLTFLGGGRGWHDSLSDTYVVSKKDLEASMKQFYEFDQIGQTLEAE